MFSPIFIEVSCDKDDEISASKSFVHGERKTTSVSNNHELRTLAPLGLSHFGPLSATKKLPSTKLLKRSIRPVFSRRRTRLCRIYRITPDLTQRVKRLKQAHRAESGSADWPRQRWYVRPRECR